MQIMYCIFAESISAAGALFPWTFSNPSSRKWLTFDLHDLCPLYRSLHCSALCCWVDAVGRSGIVVVSQSTDGITTLDVWKLQKDEKWEFLCDSLVSIWPEYEATSVRAEWYLLMFLISQYPCYVSQYSRHISNTKAIHLRGLHCNPKLLSGYNSLVTLNCGHVVLSLQGNTQYFELIALVLERSTYYYWQLVYDTVWAPQDTGYLWCWLQWI